MGIEIRPSDAVRIADFLNLEKVDFLAQYTYIEYCENEDDGTEEAVHYLFDNKGECIFLRDNRCTINDAKPMQCYLGWPDKTFLIGKNPDVHYPCIVDEDDDGTVMVYAY
jgi:hypothetical protein